LPYFLSSFGLLALYDESVAQAQIIKPVTAEPTLLKGVSPGVTAGTGASQFKRDGAYGFDADINGDGLLDYCSVYGSTNTNNSAAYLRCRLRLTDTLWSSQQSDVTFATRGNGFDLGTTSTTSANGQTKFAAVDYDGDGKADLCRLRSFGRRIAELEVDRGRISCIPASPSTWTSRGGSAGGNDFFPYTADGAAITSTQIDCGAPTLAQCSRGYDAIVALCPASAKTNCESQLISDFNARTQSSTAARESNILPKTFVNANLLRNLTTDSAEGGNFAVYDPGFSLLTYAIGQKYPTGATEAWDSTDSCSSTVAGPACFRSSSRTRINSCTEYVYKKYGDYTEFEEHAISGSALPYDSVWELGSNKRATCVSGIRLDNACIIGSATRPEVISSSPFSFLSYAQGSGTRSVIPGNSQLWGTSAATQPVSRPKNVFTSRDVSWVTTFHANDDICDGVLWQCSGLTSAEKTSLAALAAQFGTPSVFPSYSAASEAALIATLNGVTPVLSDAEQDDIDDRTQRLAAAWVSLDQAEAAWWRDLASRDGWTWTSEFDAPYMAAQSAVARLLAAEWEHVDPVTGQVDRGCFNMNDTRCDWVRPQAARSFLGRLQKERQRDLDECRIATASAPPPVSSRETLAGVDTYIQQRLSAMLPRTVAGTSTDQAFGQTRSNTVGFGSRTLFQATTTYAANWDAKVKRTSGGVACAASAGSSTSAAVNASIFGKPISVFSTSAALTGGNLSNGTPGSFSGSFTSKTSILGIDVYSPVNVSGTALSGGTAVDRGLSKSVRQRKTFTVIGVPITVEAAASIEAGMQASASATAGTANCSGSGTAAAVTATVNATPYLVSDISASAAVGVPGARAGVRGTLELVNLEVPNTGTVSLTTPSTGGDPATLNVSFSSNVTMSQLKGAIRLFAELGTLQAKKTIYSWNGFQQEYPIASFSKSYPVSTWFATAM